MPVTAAKPVKETRPVLAPTGNRVRAIEEQRRKKKQVVVVVVEKAKKVLSPSPAKPAAAAVVALCGVPADSSSDSSSSGSLCSGGTNVKSVKSEGKRGMVNCNGAVKPARVVVDGVEATVVSSVKRCNWITPNSEPLYITFHDEEWGVPVHDDMKLFEQLVYSQALAELSWPVILSKRSVFRKLFDDFDPSSVANFDEERLLSMRVQGNTLLSEPKLRAIVENAKQILKIQQEFGSFSNYCWRFVNNKPIKNGFRYTRQVPAKTPKSEFISKDLMQRGFRCVGPTVVYSFMQVAGLVNDHMLTCFRHNENETKSTPRLDKKRGLHREPMKNTSICEEASEVSCPPPLPNLSS